MNMRWNVIKRADYEKKKKVRVHYSPCEGHPLSFHDARRQIGSASIWLQWHWDTWRSGRGSGQIRWRHERRFLFAYSLSWCQLASDWCQGGNGPLDWTFFAVSGSNASIRDIDSSWGTQLVLSGGEEREKVVLSCLEEWVKRRTELNCTTALLHQRNLYPFLHSVLVVVLSCGFQHHSSRSGSVWVEARDRLVH